MEHFACTHAQHTGDRETEGIPFGPRGESWCLECWFDSADPTPTWGAALLKKLEERGACWPARLHVRGALEAGASPHQPPEQLARNRGYREWCRSHLSPYDLPALWAVAVWPRLKWLQRQAAAAGAQRGPTGFTLAMEFPEAIP